MRKQELHPRTAVLNQQQKNQSRHHRNAALNWLVKKFPKAFDTTVSIRPLKEGIMDDILVYADEALEAGISRSKLREAVVLFTRRVDYLTCLKIRDNRIDLDGNEVGQVNEEDSSRATIKIKKKVEKSARNARKALMQKASTTGQTYRPVQAVPREPQPGNHAPQYPNQRPQQAPQSYYSHNNDAPAKDPYLSDASSDYGKNGQSKVQPIRQATVVVKTKTKTYDPEAVARLKEKLGLSRKEVDKETVD